MIKFTEQLLHHNHKNLPIEKFLRVVNRTYNKKCICQVYDNDMWVKPYFDIDYKTSESYNTNIRDKILSNIKEKLLSEFDCEDEDIYYAENHRYIDDNTYKYSFHVIIDGIRTKIRELKKYSIYINSKYPDTFDTKVYNNGGGLFRFSNQIKPGTKSKPVLSSNDLSKYVIANVDIDDFEYICSHNIITATKQKTNKKYHKSRLLSKDENKYNPSAKQLDILKTILDELPVEYATDYEKWRNVCFALKNYSAHDIIFELWNTFSMRGSNYDYDSVCKLWRASKQYNLNGINIGSLIYWHKTSTKNKKNIKYGKLQIYEPVDLLENLNTVLDDDQIKTFNDQYVYKRIHKMRDQNIPFNPRSIKDKIVLIKSITGSGKTEYLQKVINYYKRMDYNILSIVSRRSLSKFHSKYFDLDNYEVVKHHSMNEVYQVDSIEKIPLKRFLKQNSDQKYILILDETHSLLTHMFNNMPKMSKNRLDNCNKLIDLIVHAESVIGTDADMSTCAIRFLKQNCDKEINLYINTYTYKYTERVTFFRSKDRILRKLEHCIKNDEYFFCCSDRLEEFRKDVILPLQEKYSKLKDQCLIYTGEEGNKEDFSQASDIWKDKYIFCSPTVLYGIDYNHAKTHHVFGFYMEGTISTLGCAQQLARVRHPISVNIFTAKHKSTRYYKNIYEMIKDIDDVVNNENDILEHTSTIDSVREFYYEHKYLNYRLENHRFHLPYILQNKGFVNIKYDNTVDNNKKNNNKNLLIERINTIVEDLLKDRQIDKTQFEVIGKRLECLGYDMGDISKDFTRNKFLMDHLDWIVDSKKFNTLFNVLIANNNKGKFNNILDDYNDLPEIKLENIFTKLQLIEQLSQYLGLDWFKLDLDRKRINEQLNIIPKDFYNKLKIVFRVSKKEVPNTYIQWFKQLGDMYNNVFSHIIYCKRTMINNKRICIKDINITHLGTINSITNPGKYDNQEYMFVD